MTAIEQHRPSTPMTPPHADRGPVEPSRSADRSAAPRVLVVSGSVGAGHDGAARELADRLTATGVQVTVRDLLTAVPRPVARLLRDGYSTSVGRAPAAFEFLFQRMERRGLFWGIEQRICAGSHPTLARWIDTVDPDVVVATYPLAAQALGALRGTGALDAPLLTYLTDPAAHASWLHPAVDAHLTVTAATAAQGRATYGYDFTVAGPLVPPRFDRGLALPELVALRAEIGLPPARPVALLVAGSLGLGDIRPAADDVVAAGFTPLVLCGRNVTLRRKVAARPGVIALGWRSDVHRLMQVADVLVHNAGGLTCTEAMVAGLPTVTYRPIPGHGRANAAVLAASGLGPWARTPHELRSVLHAQLGRDRTPPRCPDPAAAVRSWLPAAVATQLRTIPVGVR